MYRLLRTILFLFDPEKVHHFSMNMLRQAAGIGWLRRWLTGRYRPAGVSPVQVLGLQFPHHIGLAAGFDKNAAYLAELQMLGFGCVEIGTVTPRGQDGNEKPRLFRLPEDKALINRMGFNNEGADAVAARLQAWRRQHPALNDGRSMIIGGNIGKNKTTPNELAYLDYDICFRKLAQYVDYFVVNVSSPNTPGLRELQEKESLRQILTHLQGLRTETGYQLPILLKIAPDLTEEQLDDIAALATEIQLDGLVTTNTTIARQPLSDAGKIRASEAGIGGLSGAPVREKSTSVQRYLHQRLQGHIPIIASGGVFTAADVAEKLNAGAALVQVWTGFVYEGPSIVKKIATVNR